ncbi:MAG: hypothetical protein NDI69_08995 [Bacteriovoracaceae bacterium]|nr:hypothetical protein [Bacteriovoracaceae bacterium]
MQTRRKVIKKSPMTESQDRKKKDSLKRFLGYGLLEDSHKHAGLKALILKDALNSLILK